METTVKQRLIEYIGYKGISIYAFQKAIEVSTGYVKAISKSIQPDKIKRISIVYPDLNTGWLLTGEGEMLKGETPSIPKPLESNTETAKSIPIIPIAAQGGSLNDFVESVKEQECERIWSPISSAELAIPITGDSMAPEYPSGSKVLVKRINQKAFIEWGRTYVLDTCNGVVIKNLMPTEDKNIVKCVSINSDYPAFEVDMGDVYGVYRVLMIIAMK